MANTTPAPKSAYTQVRDAVLAHRDGCDINDPRTCPDCRAACDPTTINSLVVARWEAHLAKPWIDANPGLCVYCSDYATTVDHLLPKTWTGVEVRRMVPAVPACSDCNNRINDAPAFTIDDRCQVVVASLERKYRKLLASELTRDEAKKLSGRLRQAVIAQINRRDIITLRLIVLRKGGLTAFPVAS